MNDLLLIFWFFTILSIFIAIFSRVVIRNANLIEALNRYIKIKKKYGDTRNSNKIKTKLTRALKKGNEILLKKVIGEISEAKQKDMKNMIIASGASLKLEEYIMLRIFIVVALGGILFILTSNIILLLLGCIVGFITPKLYLKMRIRDRRYKFNEGLPDMLTIIVSSLKAGFSLTQSFKVVAEDCESPIKDEIGEMLREINYGVTIEDALNNLNIRMPSVDLQLMIQAILIQRQVGGNLSKILETIVETIRNRNKLERQIKTLTAQGRLSAKVIGALPWGLGFLLYVIDPKYMLDFLGTTPGKIAVAIGIVMAIIGYILIIKVSKVEV